MSEPKGTDLYRGAITHDYGSEERRALQEAVWSPTPWMVSAFDGHSHDDRRPLMRQWCVDRCGPESCTPWGKPGNWRRGGVTWDGVTWYGFATREDMEAFEAAWPTPEEMS